MGRQLWQVGWGGTNTGSRGGPNAWARYVPRAQSGRCLDARCQARVTRDCHGTMERFGLCIWEGAINPLFDAAGVHHVWFGDSVELRLVEPEFHSGFKSITMFE